MLTILGKSKKNDSKTFKIAPKKTINATHEDLFGDKLHNSIYGRGEFYKEVRYQVLKDKNKVNFSISNYQNDEINQKDAFHQRPF